MLGVSDKFVIRRYIPNSLPHNHPDTNLPRSNLIEPHISFQPACSRHRQNLEHVAPIHNRMVYPRRTSHDSDLRPKSGISEPLDAG
ncbi:hypothetical protein BDZ45DRAFT_173277 [Acephala macrosclerotiorum]|nr:hypothetical protein BDZ45DRAFT_173277 [Acephala macrosclerotiorum]